MARGKGWGKRPLEEGAFAEDLGGTTVPCFPDPHSGLRSGLWPDSERESARMSIETLVQGNLAYKKLQPP